MTSTSRLPVYFIPHGGGPWPFMDNGSRFGTDPWAGLGAFLKGFAAGLPARPGAILVISGHWEKEEQFTVSTAAHPGMLFDYYGFPSNTYELSYPAPGDPVLARHIKAVLGRSGIAVGENDERGFDHGVFVPFMVAFPEADIPVVMLSMKRELDAAEHIRMGKALESLRDEGILIIGSGMSYHNMRAFRSADTETAAIATRFDDWLTKAVGNDDSEARATALSHWRDNPDAVACHFPDHDHLVPLFVAAGAAGGDPGVRIFNDKILGKPYSGYRFG
jgi:aromatic ring-opening dioxygenase catalytic subunit (LigB family)